MPSPRGAAVVTERRAWSRWWVAVALACAGCAPTAGDKVVGWPPTEGGPPYVRDAGVTDTFLDTAPPEVVADTEPVERADGEVFAGGPCAQLVHLACELWGPHADACAEARRRVPDEAQAATAEVCTALVERFTRDEIPRGGGCWRWVAAVCRELGPTAERCREVRTLLPLVKTKRETRICLGDWLWFEARALRR